MEYANALLALAIDASHCHIEVVPQANSDWQSNPENVTKFASLLGLPVTVVTSAGHQLPKEYVSSLLDGF